MTYVASVIYNPYLQRSMHLDLHRLIKTLNASSYPALVWKTFPHNAYDSLSSSHLTLFICQYFAPSVTLELYGPAMLRNPSCIWRENFFSSAHHGLRTISREATFAQLIYIIPKANTNIFRQHVFIYWNASSFADVQSNILHDRLFSDYLCKNFSLHIPF